MNRIGKFQFSSMMLINDVFVLFCLTGGISLITAAGFGIGSILQLIISLPLISIYRKGRKLSDCGKIAEITALIGIIVWGGSLFSMLWNTGDLVFVPFEDLGKWSRPLIAALIGAACVYISSTGIKALARSAVIAAAIGAACLVIAAVSALIRSEISNLEAAKDETGLLGEVIKGFALSGGLSGAVVMLGYCKDDVRKAAVDYFAGKAIVSVIVTAVGVLVCGGIMKITDFPIATAAQLSQPFAVQRIDSLFLIIFTVFAVYSVAVQAGAADILLGELIPKFTRYRCMSVLAVMAVLGAVFGGDPHYGLVFAIASVAVFVIAPVMSIFNTSATQ